MKVHAISSFLFISFTFPIISIKYCTVAKNTANGPPYNQRKEAYMKLGELLTMLRKEKGYLQKDVAAYLHLTVATVSNYEKNVRMPNLETLVRLADLYDVSTDYLLQRTRCKTGVRALGRHLSADCTVGDLINTILHLDRFGIRFLLECCDLLRLRSRLNDGNHL